MTNSRGARGSPCTTLTLRHDAHERRCITLKVTLGSSVDCSPEDEVVVIAAAEDLLRMTGRSLDDLLRVQRCRDNARESLGSWREAEPRDGAPGYWRPAGGARLTVRAFDVRETEWVAAIDGAALRNEFDQIILFASEYAAKDAADERARHADTQLEAAMHKLLYATTGETP